MRRAWSRGSDTASSTATGGWLGGGGQFAERPAGGSGVTGTQSLMGPAQASAGTTGNGAGGTSPPPTATTL